MLTDEERKERNCASSRKYRLKHLEECRATSTAWRHANPEKKRLLGVAWRHTNSEKDRLRHAAWNHSNPEKKHLLNAAWRHTNFEKVRLQSGKWKHANPEKVCALNEKRRAAKYANTPIDEMLTSTEWLAILAEANGHCHYCDKEAKLTLDHVIPLSRGGKHSKDNVVPACAHCNNSKGTKTVEAWKLIQAKK